jgi:hypothetical protein
VEDTADEPGDLVGFFAAIEADLGGRQPSIAALRELSAHPQNHQIVEHADPVPAGIKSMRLTRYDSAAAAPLSWRPPSLTRAP